MRNVPKETQVGTDACTDILWCKLGNLLIFSPEPSIPKGVPLAVLYVARISTAHVEQKLCGIDRHFPEE